VVGVENDEECQEAAIGLSFPMPSVIANVWFNVRMPPGTSLRTPLLLSNGCPPTPRSFGGVS